MADKKEPKVVADKKEPKVELTKAGSHVAKLKGFDGRKVVLPGQSVEGGIPVSDVWMKSAPKRRAEDDEAE